MVADRVVYWANLIVLGVTVLVEAFAFVSCVTRRADAFPVVGKLTKGTWVLMTLGALVFTLLTYSTFLFGGNIVFSLIALAGITVALVYILDVRPAIRDVVDGHGSW
jgi:hypothetical protein